MPSASLQRWRNDRHSALEEIEAAHRSIGGEGPGRRYATQQINHAYAVLLSSQFQGFCRDLFLECADHFLHTVPSGPVRTTLRNVMIQNLRLNVGNPTPGGIGSDYNRFGLSFWDEVQALDPRNESRQDRLEELNAWRNAIAHQDFDPRKLAGAKSLHLRKIREWRTACNLLAESFDEVMRAYLLAVNSVSPW